MLRSRVLDLVHSRSHVTGASCTAIMGKVVWDEAYDMPCAMVVFEHRASSIVATDMPVLLASAGWHTTLYSVASVTWRMVYDYGVGLKISWL